MIPDRVLIFSLIVAIFAAFVVTGWQLNEASKKIDAIELKVGQISERLGHAL